MPIVNIYNWLDQRIIQVVRMARRLREFVYVSKILERKS